jgi:hypothetical protein
MVVPLTRPLPMPCISQSQVAWGEGANAASRLVVAFCGVNTCASFNSAGRVTGSKDDRVTGSKRKRIELDTWIGGHD